MNRFNQLTFAFHRMLGRAEMSRRYGFKLESRRQMLAASRLLSWATQHANDR